MPQPLMVFNTAVISFKCNSAQRRRLDFTKVVYKNNNDSGQCQGSALDILLQHSLDILLQHSNIFKRLMKLGWSQAPPSSSPLSSYPSAEHFSEQPTSITFSESFFLLLIVQYTYSIHRRQDCMFSNIFLECLWRNSQVHLKFSLRPRACFEEWHQITHSSSIARTNKSVAQE